MFSKASAYSLGIALILSPLSALADDSISGAYKLSEDAKKAEKRIEKIIEEGTADMNFITRGIARGKLKDALKPHQKIELKLSGDQVEIVDARGPLVAPSSGKCVKPSKPRGKAKQVCHAFKGRVVVQTIKTPEAVRIAKYTVGADKTMRAEFTLKSERLPKPIKYTLKYKPTK